MNFLELSALLKTAEPMSIWYIIAPIQQKAGAISMAPLSMPKPDDLLETSTCIPAHFLDDNKSFGKAPHESSRIYNMPPPPQEQQCAHSVPLAPCDAKPQRGNP